jgi:hypothetical protein
MVLSQPEGQPRLMTRDRGARNCSRSGASARLDLYAVAVAATRSTVNTSMVSPTLMSL